MCLNHGGAIIASFTAGQSDSRNANLRHVELNVTCTTERSLYKRIPLVCKCGILFEADESSRERAFLNPKLISHLRVALGVYRVYPIKEIKCKVPKKREPA